MVSSKEEIIKQIDWAIKFYAEHRQKCDDLSDLERGVSQEVRTIVSATLQRLAPVDGDIADAVF